MDEFQAGPLCDLWLPMLAFCFGGSQPVRFPLPQEPKLATKNTEAKDSFWSLSKVWSIHLEIHREGIRCNAADTSPVGLF